MSTNILANFLFFYSIASVRSQGGEDAGNSLPLSSFVDQLSDSGLSNLLGRLPTEDLKVLNRFIDDPKIEYAYKETDSRFQNEGILDNDMEEIEYIYEEEDEAPKNSKNKRGCPPPSKVRNKRENSDDEREDSASNEEYIRLLESSFPENFDDNNVVLNIGEMKPNSHVRVKRH